MKPIRKNKFNRQERDYKRKITYWQNELNESINCAPIDYSHMRVCKALNSLTHFVKRQLEVNKTEGEL